jgi:hypothetical protein
MERPKPKVFSDGVRKMKPIDTVAKEGAFIKGDMPGIDTYGDGLNDEGELVMPGSTATESGGIYMEDKGPNDLRRRNEADLADAPEASLTVAGPEDILAGDDVGVDEAEKWLRKHDKTHPKFEGGDDVRQAA